MDDDMEPSGERAGERERETESETSAAPHAPESPQPPVDEPTEPLARSTDATPTPVSPMSAPAWPLPPADPAGAPFPPPHDDTTAPGFAPPAGAAADAPPATIPAPSPLIYGAAPPAPGASGPTTPTSSRPWIAITIVAALVGGLVGAGVTALADNNNSNSDNSVTIKESNTAPGAATLNGASIPQLVTKVIPSVVSIDVKSNGSEDEGTGMIVTSNGEVITNNHVIELYTDDGNTGTITVTEYGQAKALPATLVGYDTTHDVALLKINNASNLPTVTFGNSNKAQVGDFVVAIGNALGLAAGTPTVTQGIISALGRSVTAGGEGTQAENLTNLVQTDAAINPGNSGGPLLDTAGQVIAMNTAVAGTSNDGSSAQNIGFAIPIAEVESLIPQLLKGGSATTGGGGYLGVDITTMTASLRQEYGLTPSTGALILSVVSGSPAANAGLQQGDVIVAVNGTAVTSAEQLQSTVQKDKSGQSISVTFYAGSNKQTVSVTLGNQSQAAQQEGGAIP